MGWLPSGNMPVDQVSVRGRVTSPRTLALEAMFPPEDQASRRAITEMMVSNVSSSIVDVPGTIYMARRQSIVDLIRRSAIDANMGASLLVEEAATRQTRS